MNIGLYQSAASLNSLERWQDAVAQNITSSQITGFRRRTVQVAAESNGEIMIDAGSRPDRGEGMATLFPQTRYGITFKPGENHPTRRDLDVAISGDGFLTVRKPDGELAYTRDGQLRVRADRTLVNSQGLEILSELGNPIQLQSQGGSPVILPDGTIRQGDTVIGMLGIANTADPSRLIPLAGGLFAPGAGAAMKPVENPVVQQGYLESSNVAPLREMVDLVSIARAYEANQKLIQTRDKLMGTTIETFS
ncbi:MAG: flagellar hook-basal body protein [Opitutaceae bacterium]|jgi:flagellar basal body rod protein FlgG